MSSLLDRQIRKYLPEHLKDSPEMDQFLEAVGKSYRNYDDKLTMIQRATKISSDELYNANRELEAEAQRQKKVLSSLEEAVKSLNSNLEEGIMKDAEVLPVDVEKLAFHIKNLASDVTRITDEKSILLKDLEAQNESLNNYIHMVSHDLKTPLRNIHALMSWILEEEKCNFSESSKANCALVGDNLSRMDNLISGILRHATVERETKKRSNVDTSALIGDIINKLEIPEKVNMHINNNLPVIPIQKLWAEQIFINLIENAVTATEHIDNPKIEIDFIEEDEFWKFTVKDNGKGIPEKHRVKIFEMFSKLENGTNAAGVGLALVKKITGLLNGDVWLESKMGEGTTFFITLKKE
ncbi:sensor histidine kinase [Maribacter sp. CXY002]|uniref:sensor histidine kinase n=1 Tax=Maribacter luteocoastalis TaxID=3407671 RepID=UPI003B682930